MARALSLEVTNTPETVKVRRSNLTGPGFRKTGNIPFRVIFLPMFCQLSCHIVDFFAVHRLCFSYLKCFGSFLLFVI